MTVRNISNVGQAVMKVLVQLPLGTSHIGPDNYSLAHASSANVHGLGFYPILNLSSCILCTVSIKEK
jgi:hypothetical protein